jgi:hypothetical protein
MSSTNETVAQVDRLVTDLCKQKKTPLLVLYYHEYAGDVRWEDVGIIYDELRRGGFSRENKMDKLYVLLHTFGGDPDAGYRIAQVMRDFAKNIIFLVPEYACSAGTLICMCGDKIELGDYAFLSPIDITIERKGPLEPIELMSIDYYIKFVKQCRQEIEQMLRDSGFDSSTNVENELLCEMVRQVGSLRLGTFFRTRVLTGFYAETLLLDYMFAQASNKEDLKNKVIRTILFDYPSHSFCMDFHISLGVGLPVEEMPVAESDMTKNIISLLKQLTLANVICRDISDSYKAPFIKLYVGERDVANG